MPSPGGRVLMTVPFAARWHPRLLAADVRLIACSRHGFEDLAVTRGEMR